MTPKLSPKASLLSFVFMATLAACGSDTSGDGTATCAEGQLLNPVTGSCEAPIADEQAPSTNGRTPSNDGNSSDNGDSSPADGCPTCALHWDPTAVEFTYTPAMETNSSDVELFNATDAEITVDSKRWTNSTAPEFVVRGLDTPVRIAPQSRRTVTVEHNPQDLTDDDVVLELFSEGSDLPVARLPITTSVIGEGVCSENCPKIVVDPPSLSFSYSPDSAPMQGQLVIGSVGDAPLEVREVLLVQQGAEFGETHEAVPLALAAGGTSSIAVTFDPSGTTLRIPDASLLIRSTDPWVPEVVVPIKAVSKSNASGPCIAVSPTSLAFGSMQRGQSATQNFSIENCGNQPLNVTEIRRGSFFGIQTSQAFQLTGWTQGTIAPGDRQNVEMTYSPRRAGTDIGHFDVHSDGEPSSVRVNVRGTGEPPPIADQDIHIQVDWDSNDTDVDTHVLLLPGSGLFCDNDCNFSNPEPDWGTPGDWRDDPFLDVDDVDGFGPENVNIAQGIDGMKYRVVLHYWDDTYNESFPDSSDATVRLYIRGQLKQEWGPKHLSSTGDTWNVFEIDWPSQNITTLNDSIYQVPSSTSCRATP